MTKVIMHGCNGKMGQTITAMCKDDPEIEIVAGVDLYDGIKITLYFLISHCVMWRQM